ncbi:MAG: hypothetical protein Q8K61_01290 [Gallionella sp.]|nr:hypothetical protein [Gallionella sp.]
MNIALNTSPQLHFEHIRNTSNMPRDARSDRAAQLAWENFYFVGFRIDSAYGERYHHALILADDHDTFLSGIAAEHLELLNYDWITSAQDISVIFIENLMMQNPALIGETCQAPAKANSSSAPRRNSNAFSVIGFTDSNQFCRLEVDSDNALKAIDEANAQVNYECGAQFKPLLISQLNAVAIDFFNLLNTVVESVKELMGGAATNRGYLH